MKVAFNKRALLGSEIKYMEQALLAESKLSGDGPYTLKCQKWMEAKMDSKRVLLTPSCTAALEMTALLARIQPGDEVIMPSYTFVSTANAFVLRGARIKFVDIRPDTMNMDETRIEQAITSKTRAIVPVHYAGVGCEMDEVLSIAERHRLFVVEDAAQGVMATYKGRPLGSIGHLGCFSFHETKNYTSGGEGGALLIRDESLIEEAEVIREKGTDRSQFLRGQVDKYTWRGVGSSYLPSDLQAAFLLAQLEQAEVINRRRLAIWNRYFEAFSAPMFRERVEIPSIPGHCVHNAHLFYLKMKDLEQRTEFIEFMSQHGVAALFHYVPLHLSVAGKKYGEFCGEDRFTTKESERLVRLPLWYNMNESEVSHVIESVHRFVRNVRDDF